MISILKRLPRIFNINSKDELHYVSSSIDNMLNNVSSDVKLLDDQYDLRSSIDVYLDEWGSWFGISRMPGESDNDYRGRLLSTALASKNTVPAIIEALENYYNGYLGSTPYINIYEPFEDLDVITPEDYVGYMNENYYQRGVIDIQIYDFPITPGVSQIIEETKSGGIHYYITRIDRNVIDEGKITTATTQIIRNTEIVVPLYNEILAGTTLVYAGEEIIIYDLSSDYGCNIVITP